MKTIKRFFTSLYTMTIGSIIIIMIVFAVSVSLIGYFAFSSSFEKEYYDSVQRIANLVTSNTMAGIDPSDYLQYSQETMDEMKEYRNYNEYVNQCNIDGIEPDEETFDDAYTYNFIKDEISDVCNIIGVSVIYAIVPDEDFKHYTCVFNCVNKNSGYDPWDMGYRVETPSEYYEAYERIYNHGSKIEVVERYTNLGKGKPHVTAIAPLKNEEGDICGILCVQRFAEGLTNTRRNFVQGIGGLAAILIIIIMLLESRFLRKQVVQPIERISKEAERFARDSKDRELPTAQTIGSNICKVNEIVSLAESIDNMEIDTIKSIEDITTMTKEKERVDADITLASKIQLGMLPQKNQLIENHKEFDVSAAMKPAKEVGGDFYDFFMVDDTHLAILVADVSDKGVGAAFFMAIAKTLIKARARLGGDPAEMIEYVDALIAEKNPQGMFVTVWFGIIDIINGHVKVCNAGHDYPAILGSDGVYKIEKTPHGPAVGFIPGAKQIGYEFDMAPGNRIFLYTDGLNEAKRSDGERFGISRILEVLNDNKELDNDQMILKMKLTVNAFAGDEPQFDDMTMLSFTYNGRN